MLSWFRKRPPADDPRVLRLRPPAGFGDHLMLSAVVEGLKAEHPDLQFYLLARHPELFRHNPHVEETLYVGRVKKRRPELFDQYRYISHRPPAERYLQVYGHLIDDMYREIGIGTRARPRQPRIYLTRWEERYRGRELERLARPRVAIVPSGRADRRLLNKVYPPEQWEELGRLLVSAPGCVLQLGSSKDGPLLPGTRDYRDVGFRRTAAVLRHCDLLVTHVGGIMHLAAAVGTPAVVLYGATEHPGISGYAANRNLYVPIECGPCWLEVPCSHLTCMKRLTPALAFEAVRETLAARGAAA